MGGPLTGPSQEVTHATSPAVLQPESVQHPPRPGRSGNVGPGAERSAARQMTEGAPRPRRASAHAASASAAPRRLCPGLRSRRRPPDRNRIGTGSSGRPARKSEKPAGQDHCFRSQRLHRAHSFVSFLENTCPDCLMHPTPTSRLGIRRCHGTALSLRK